MTIGKFVNILSRITARIRTGFAASQATVKPADEASGLKRCQVLFINGTDLQTLRRYRVQNQREQLELRGISTDEVHYTHVCDDDASRAEVFVIYRCPITPEIDSFIRAAHSQGKRVYYDVDDLVTDTRYTDSLSVVQAMSPEEKGLFDDGMRRNGATLKMCDGVIVTTERLAAELADNVPVTLINRNIASEELVTLSNSARKGKRPRKSRTDSGVVVGYFSGSMTHNKDFAVVLPALVKVMRDHPQLRIKVVGDLELPAELKPFAQRVILADRVDWKELPTLIASVDINLAPLEPSLFNECKSEIKWLEASLVGVPTIASDFGSFARAMRHGETGLLCSNQSEWEDALATLVDDAVYRSSLGENARSWCLAHNTSISTGDALVHFLLPDRADIDSLVPYDETARRRRVLALLESRGLTPPEDDAEENQYLNHPWQAVSLDRRREDALTISQTGKRLVIFVYERGCGDDATFRYYGYNAVQRLTASKRWGGIWLFIDELESASDLVPLASGVVLIRCRIRPELILLYEMTARIGIPLGYMLDDNALGKQTAPRIIQSMASDPSSEFETAFWTGVTERFKLAADLCSCMIAPVDSLASLLSAATGEPAFTIHASLNDEQVHVANHVLSSGRTTRADNRMFIAYFSGTSSHALDFSLVKGALSTFLAGHPDACLLLGGHLAIPDDLCPYLASGQLMLVPQVDYVTLQFLQAAADVVLAPLVIDEFTNCKSALKVFEAGVVGTPACASPSFAYLEAVSDKDSGFICSEDGDWTESLESLFDDRQRLQLMGEQARFHALSHYYGDAILEQIEGACDALATQQPVANADVSKAAVQSRDAVDWDDPFVTNVSFA